MKVSPAKFREIEKRALEFGFSGIQVAQAGFLEKEAPLLEKWLNKGFHGKMNYMENWMDKRLNPKLLVEGAKSVMMLSFNYFPNKIQNIEAPKIAKYAYGEDYHHVLKEKLVDIVSYIKEDIGEINARIYVDSAPVMERAWAEHSGLGWIGKNSLLLRKKEGSFFFLACIISDIEFEAYGTPVTDHCGSCTKCIDSCPTEAIVDNKVVDATKCISYLTIELKEQIPAAFKGKMENWVFGCDICQDVCPWNRFSKAHQENKFIAKDPLLLMNQQEWYEMTETIFKELFRKSAVKRTKFEGLQRNLIFIKED